MTGVYFLYYKKQLQYIGQSTNIWRRVEQHTGKIPYDVVSVVMCDTESLSDLERQCIWQYKPLLNVRLNKGCSMNDRMIMSVEVDEQFKTFLRSKAKQNKKTVSAYIRAALAKASNYQEQLI